MPAEKNSPEGAKPKSPQTSPRGSPRRQSVAQPSTDSTLTSPKRTAENKETPHPTPRQLPAEPSHVDSEDSYASPGRGKRILIALDSNSGSRTNTATATDSSTRHAPVRPSVERLLQSFLALQSQVAGTWLPFLEQDMEWMLHLVRALFLSQPSLLELAAPVTIMGDTHGQFHDLLRLFELVGYPGTKNFLFLGDYVDRGKNSLDVVATLFCYKVQYPYNMFLLRGNHETAATSRCYGFFDEVKRRSGVKLWRRFVDVFNCMPPAALVGKRILCMHGGISPTIMESLDPIRELQRPCECSDSGLLADLLWADPDARTSGFRYQSEKCPHPRTWEHLYCKNFQMKHSPSCIYQHHRVPIVNSKNLYCKRTQQEWRLSCKRCDTRLDSASERFIFLSCMTKSFHLETSHHKFLRLLGWGHFPL
ncbi:unnamed protein product [Amoebophrya sp. A120]|nr:unnamed protein product [Amoebophrya sp. A120]|eukprot:GSA120T00024066001.1